jgi:hypothetical protein
MTFTPRFRRGRHRRQRTPRTFVALRPILPIVLIAALASVVMVVPTHGQSASAAVQPFSGTCPGGISACVEVSLPCSTQPCPTVVAGPTQNLVTDQYVFLSMANFPAGDAVRVAFCTTDGSGTIVSDPYCATNTGGGVALNKQFVLTNAQGSANTTAAVAYDPAGQDNPPLAAVPLVQNGDPASSFFCDNGPDFCSLVITDDGPIGAGPMDTSANTVIVPLNFSLGASACPTSAPILFTDSSFTIEHLIPATVQATCSEKNGVVALDTATNTASEMNDLATGGTPIAFTDDGSDSQLLNELPRSTGFAYIPVALSATVVGFMGTAPDENQAGVVFPVAQYKMTPNMVAGVLTTSYSGGGTADDLVTAPTKQDVPPLDCADLVGCNKKTTALFNTFYLLNPEPTGVGQPGAIGSFFSNTVEGTNYQLTDWLCSAPNAPFQLSLPIVGSSGNQNVSVTDTYNTATGTITTPPTESPFWDTNTPASAWPFKSCTPTSQFPSLDPGGLSQYNPSDTPALQSNSIRNYGSGGNLGFGAMDWSEASFNGMDVVALQNASGNFVSPTQTSIDAALDDAIEDSNGVLDFDYDDASDSAAYPMPMVTYAVVPTAPVPAAQAQNVTNFLTNLISVSSGKVGTLPGGYVPLPSGLVTQALTDIANDVVAQPTNSSTTSSSAASAAGSSSPTGSGVNDAASGGLDTGSNNLGDTYNVGSSSSPASSAPGTSSGSTPTTAAGPATNTAGGTTVATAGLDVLVAGTRYVLPILIALAIASVIIGPTLLALPPRRRRGPVSSDRASSTPEGGTP